jgi:hypothetical protein
MTKNITLTVSDETYALIKQHPEIKWSEIARRGIESFVLVLAKVDETEKKMKKEYGNKNVSTSVNGGVSQSINGTSKGGHFITNVSLEATVVPKKIKDKKSLDDKK